MLTSLLPGLRQLRAPFVAGALLGATLYVAVVDLWSPLVQYERLGPGLRSLLDALGPSGLLAVLSVFAYLTGAVYLSALQHLLQKSNRKVLGNLVSVDFVDGRKSIPARITAPFTTPSLVRLRRRCHGDPQLTEQVCSEILSDGGKRLLTTNLDLYGEYDRMRSEAEFRYAITLPAFGFLIISLMQVDWPFIAKLTLVFICIVGFAILLMQARFFDRDANSIYAHAVADGVVSTASLRGLPTKRPANASSPRVTRASRRIRPQDRDAKPSRLAGGGSQSTVSDRGPAGPRLI